MLLLNVMRLLLNAPYQRRPFLVDMADCEFIERFRLSRARIEWLVEEMKEELERNTARRSPLASEARVSICCFILKKTFV